MQMFVPETVAHRSIVTLAKIQVACSVQVFFEQEFMKTKPNLYFPGESQKCLD